MTAFVVSQLSIVPQYRLGMFGRRTFSVAGLFPTFCVFLTLAETAFKCLLILHLFQSTEVSSAIEVLQLCAMNIGILLTLQIGFMCSFVVVVGQVIG